MKRIIAYTLMASVLLLTACGKNTDQNLFSTVTLHAVLPDAGNMVSIRIDPSLKGNFFRNVNTGENYEYPLFVNGYCTVQVQKGVYMLGFDGKATFADGTEKNVRCSRYSSATSAVNLLEDVETVELTLMAR